MAVVTPLGQLIDHVKQHRCTGNMHIECQTPDLDAFFGSTSLNPKTEKKH
jgi:hypothetical protein